LRYCGIHSDLTVTSVPGDKLHRPVSRHNLGWLERLTDWLAGRFRTASEPWVVRIALNLYV
jgi:hypothetical protein